MSATNTTSDDCWKKIGVHGDGSCPELKQHIHCRNCPVYSAAGIRLLNRPLPPGHLREWTSHFANPERVEAAGAKTTFIFRVAGEWLSLPPPLFLEILEARPVHSLPHRRKGAVLGLVNVRGELLICVSLHALLGLEALKNGKQPAGGARLLVIGRRDGRFVFPADEVHGVHRYDPGALKKTPATVAKSTPVHTAGVLEWGDKSVGCLDEEALFSTFNRSLG
jgi:chemotaxis-related protein WspD